MPSPLSARDVAAIRRQISPTLRDNLVEIGEVWRMPSVGVSGIPAGGAGLNSRGEEVEENHDPAHTDQERVKIAEYPCRIVKNTSGGETVAGQQPFTIGAWMTIFNGADAPDIAGGDKLIFAVTERVNGVWQRKVWTAATPYVLDDVVQPSDSNGREYTCTVAGTSDSSEPTWPLAAVGDTVVDGGVTWTYTAKLRTFEVVDPSGASTQQINRIVGCEEVKS